MRSEGVAVRVSGVRKSFGQTVALDGVDLVVRKGSVHGLLGPNGAGKSTLLRILLGLAAPDSGSVAVLGGDPLLGGTRLDRVAGFVDAPRFHPYLSVARTLAMLAVLDGGDASGRVDPALAAVDLERVRGRKVGRLSTGQRQRLALAAALLRDPLLLIVDEPTTGLDPAGTEQLRELVADLASSGRSVLLSSHDMTEVDRLCDDVTVVQSGHAVYSGSLAQLRRRATVSVFRLRTSDGDRAREVYDAHTDLEVTRVEAADVVVTGATGDVDRLVLDLSARGIAVRELVPTRTALETEFLRLVGVS